MLTHLFNYKIEKSNIAYFPRNKKNKTKLLILNKKTKKISHKKITDITNIIKQNDLLVLNDTKVIPAKLIFKNGKKNIEILILKILIKNEAICYVNLKKNITHYINLNKKKIKIYHYKNNLFKISIKNYTINEILNKYGLMPLPPYIKRQQEDIDAKTYQTIYSKNQGSIAAPTAGLHFYTHLLKKMKNMNIKIDYITLHIGPGTFESIKKKNINNHKMHFEYIKVSKSLCNNIKKTKKTGNKIIACGTTTVRALETAALSGKIKPFDGETNIFIKPGFKFNITDSIITNFHLPRSTLLILVSAFCDMKTILKTYECALKHKYKFYSYGDAMLIY